MPLNCSLFTSLPILRMAQDPTPSSNGTYIVVVAQVRLTNIPVLFQTLSHTGSAIEVKPHTICNIVILFCVSPQYGGIYMSFDGGANFSASFSFTDPFPFMNETVLPDEVGIGNFTNCTLLNGTMDGNGTCFDANGTAINNVTDGLIYLASHEAVFALYARADEYRQRQHRLQSAALGARYTGSGDGGDAASEHESSSGGPRRLFSKHGKQFNSFRYGDPELRRRHLLAQEERVREQRAQWQRHHHSLHAIDTGPLVGPGFTGLLNSTLLNCSYINGTLIDDRSDVNCSRYMNATAGSTPAPPACPLTGKLNLIRREVARAASGIIAAAVSIATFAHPDAATADAVSVLGKDAYADSYRRFAWNDAIAANATLRMTWVGVASCASVPRVVTLYGQKYTLPPPCYYHITWSNDEGQSWFDFGPVSEPRTREPFGWFGLGSTPDPNFCLLADPYVFAFASCVHPPFSLFLGGFPRTLKPSSYRFLLHLRALRFAIADTTPR